MASQLVASGNLSSVFSSWIECSWTPTAVPLACPWRCSWKFSAPANGRLAFSENAVPDVLNRVPVSDLQPDAVQLSRHLAGLKPARVVHPGSPGSAGLVRRFVDVPAQSEQGLVVFDKAKHVG